PMLGTIGFVPTPSSPWQTRQRPARSRPATASAATPGPVTAKASPSAGSQPEITREMIGIVTFSWNLLAGAPPEGGAPAVWHARLRRAGVGDAPDRAGEV